MNLMQLRRYSDAELERMLLAYRALADSHHGSGHWALAHWAAGEAGDIARELNRRWHDEQRESSRQLPLFPNSRDT